MAEDEQKDDRQTEDAVSEKSQSGDAEREQKQPQNSDFARKLIFALCYLWGILFFVPLIAYPNDAQAKRHANAGLVLLLSAVVGNIVFGLLTLIPVLNVIFSVIASLYSVALLVLGIIGIYYVVTDRDKDLPLVGKFKLLK